MVDEGRGCLIRINYKHAYTQYQRRSLGTSRMDVFGKERSTEFAGGL